MLEDTMGKVHVLLIFAILSAGILAFGAKWLLDEAIGGYEEEDHTEYTATVIDKHHETVDNTMMIPSGNTMIPIVDWEDIYTVNLHIESTNETVDVEVGSELYDYIQSGDTRQVAVTESGRAWLLDKPTGQIEPDVNTAESNTESEKSAPDEDFDKTKTNKLDERLNELDEAS